VNSQDRSDRFHLAQKNHRKEEQGEKAKGKTEWKCWLDQSFILVEREKDKLPQSDLDEETQNAQ
jgi:hypothetical protein